MNPSGTCPMAKPPAESARPCATTLLRRAMYRNVPVGSSDEQENSYSFKDIEDVIFRNTETRTKYLEEVATIALLLSISTRIGRIAFTFHDMIFNKTHSLDTIIIGMSEKGKLPEIFDNPFLSTIDAQRYIQILALEKAAMVKGLNTIVRKCCDSKVCDLQEMDQAYDEELFKRGSIFEQAAKSMCILRRVEVWAPPVSEIMIPIQYKMSRSFRESRQVTCLDVNNLIHVLSSSEDRPEMPWGNELIPVEMDKQLREKYSAEIQMRKYYLKSK